MSIDDNLTDKLHLNFFFSSIIKSVPFYYKYNNLKNFVFICKKQKIYYNKFNN